MYYDNCELLNIIDHLIYTLIFNKINENFLILLEYFPLVKLIFLIYR